MLDRLKEIKCVVWDLDNTLWEGTLLEDREVSLKPGIQAILEELDSRGILLSIASKNEREVALEQLRTFGVQMLNRCPSAVGLQRTCFCNCICILCGATLPTCRVFLGDLDSC